VVLCNSLSAASAALKVVQGQCYICVDSSNMHAASQQVHDFLQEPPPDSQPPGDDSDRLLLDALKAAAPGTELAVDEDEPIPATAAPAEHAGGNADGDEAAAAAAAPQLEAAAVRDAAGSAAEAASGDGTVAASVAVVAAAAERADPAAAGEAVTHAEPSLSEQTLINKVKSPATVTGE
jgi:hypothetical protein